MTLLFFSFLEVFARLDIMEKDGSKYNHLFSFRHQGKELLLSYRGHQIGDEGYHYWIVARDVECRKVSTVEELRTIQVSGTVYLCTAKEVTP